MSKYKFQPGETNKEKQPFWNKKWLANELNTKNIVQLSKELNVSRTSIHYWIVKHKLEEKYKDAKGLVMEYFYDNGLRTQLWCHGKKVNSGQFGICIHE